MLPTSSHGKHAIIAWIYSVRYLPLLFRWEIPQFLARQLGNCQFSLEFNSFLLACKPCAPTGDLPVCTVYCKSITYRCGMDYVASLKQATGYDMELSDNTCECADDTDPECRDSNCFNSVHKVAGSLLALLLPTLLLFVNKQSNLRCVTRVLSSNQWMRPSMDVGCPLFSNWNWCYCVAHLNKKKGGGHHSVRAHHAPSIDPRGR